MERIDLAILGAVPEEMTELSKTLPVTGRVELAGNSFTLHGYRSFSLLLGTTGLGKVNAAAVTAALLTRFAIREVWNGGCAGAYREGGLSIGDVLITGDCLCGDEGVLEKGTVFSSARIAIPLLRREGREFYDRFPLEEFERRRKTREVLPPGRYRVDFPSSRLEPAATGGPSGDSFALAYGPSLTVGMASGDPETAAARFRRYGALAENMEGSGAAQACFLFGIPFFECRGISNIAGVREKEQWDMKLALAHCHAVLARLLETLGSAA